MTTTTTERQVSLTERNPDEFAGYPFIVYNGVDCPMLTRGDVAWNHLALRPRGTGWALHRGDTALDAYNLDPSYYERFDGYWCGQAIDRAVTLDHLPTGTDVEGNEVRYLPANDGFAIIRMGETDMDHEDLERHGLPRWVSHFEVDLVGTLDPAPDYTDFYSLPLAWWAGTAVRVLTVNGFPLGLRRADDPPCGTMYPGTDARVRNHGEVPDWVDARFRCWWLTSAEYTFDAPTPFNLGEYPLHTTDEWDEPFRFVAKPEGAQPRGYQGVAIHDEAVPGSFVVSAEVVRYYPWMRHIAGRTATWITGSMTLTPYDEDEVPTDAEIEAYLTSLDCMSVAHPRIDGEHPYLSPDSHPTGHSRLVILPDDHVEGWNVTRASLARHGLARELLGKRVWWLADETMDATDWTPAPATVRPEGYNQWATYIGSVPAMQGIRFPYRRDGRYHCLFYPGTVEQATRRFGNPRWTVVPGGVERRITPDRAVEVESWFETLPLAYREADRTLVRVHENPVGRIAVWATEMEGRGYVEVDQRLADSYRMPAEAIGMFIVLDSTSVEVPPNCVGMGTVTGADDMDDLEVGARFLFTDIDYDGLLRAQALSPTPDGHNAHHFYRNEDSPDPWYGWNVQRSSVRLDSDPEPEPEPEVSEEVAALLARVEELERESADAGREVERVRSQLEQARTYHREDLAAIGERLQSEAVAKEWCEEYEEVVDSLNGSLHGDVSDWVREEDYEVVIGGDVDARWRRTVTITGPRGMDRDDLEDAVREHLESHPNYNYNCDIEAEHPSDSDFEIIDY